MNLNVKMTIQPPASSIRSDNWVYRRRSILNKVMLTLSMAALVFGLFWLVWILAVLVIKGGGALSLSLFTEITPPPGQAGGLLP